MNGRKFEVSWMECGRAEAEGALAALKASREHVKAVESSNAALNARVTSLVEQNRLLNIQHEQAGILNQEI